MAFSNVALFGGAFLTPVVVGKMTATLGWQWSFYFVAIFTAAALPFVFFFVPETAYRRADYLNMDFSGDAIASANHGQGGSQTGIVDSTSQSPDNSHVAQEKPHPSRLRNEITSNTAQYSYWQTLKLFNGRKTDENFLKLFLRPFPLFFHPGILWVSSQYPLLIKILTL